MLAEDGRHRQGNEAKRLMVLLEFEGPESRRRRRDRIRIQAGSNRHTSLCGRRRSPPLTSTLLDVESRQVPAVDAVTAAALTLAAQGRSGPRAWPPASATSTAARPVLSVTAALMTVPLAWRRSRPAPACLTVLAAGAAQSLLHVPSEGLSTLAALLLAAYSLAAGTSGLLRYAGALAVAGHRGCRR